MSVKKKKTWKKLNPEIERLYRHFGGFDGWVVNDIGRKQFFDFEVSSIEPSEPDSYFLQLKSGKKWYNWQVEQFREIWLTPEWVGWYNYHEDFKKNDELWMLKHLFGWCKTTPGWFYDNSENN